MYKTQIDAVAMVMGATLQSTKHCANLPVGDPIHHVMSFDIIVL